MTDKGQDEATKRRAWGANRVNLNVRKLESLRARPGEAHSEYMDSGLRGFGVRIYATGRRVFIVRFKPKGRSQERRDLEETTLTAARAKAGEILEVVRQGRDPFLSHSLLKKADISTIEELCRAYLADPTPKRGNEPLADETRKGIKRVIEREIIPIFGAREPNSLQPEELEAWARGIATDTGRVNDNARGEARYLGNRVLDYLQMVYSWARRRRILVYTPFVPGLLMKPHAEESRKRIIEDDELRRIFAALHAAPRQIAAVYIALLLTGLRLSAVTKMPWAWVDVAGGNVAVPPKAPGRKGKKHPLLVPLVPDLKRLLVDWLRPMAGESPYVFPGTSADRPLGSTQRAMGRVLSAAGVEDARNHDTRRVVQSHLSALGVDVRVSDRILDHREDGPASRAAYELYGFRKEKLAALTAWAKRLRKIVGVDLLSVLETARTGYQGKGPARRTGHKEGNAERKARLLAAGRDYLAERRAQREARAAK